MYISNLNDLYLMACDDFDLIAYLQARDLLPSSLGCPTCLLKCQIYCTNDSYVFRCTRWNCSFKSSLNNNTWFSKSKMNYATILKIIFAFVHSEALHYCAFNFNLAAPTVVDWYSSCREICIAACLRSKSRIGGKTKVVEIEEIKFHKPHTDEGHWICGGVERGPKGRCFMMMVGGRGEAALLHILQTRIEPGTTLISDADGSSGLNFHTDAVRGFRIKRDIIVKKPIPSTTSTPFDGGWKCVKKTLLTGGCKKDNFIGYFAAYMWRSFYNKKDIFEEFLEEVATQHPIKSEAYPDQILPNELNTDYLQPEDIKQEAPIWQTKTEVDLPEMEFKEEPINDPLGDPLSQSAPLNFIDFCSVKTEPTEF